MHYQQRIHNYDGKKSVFPVCFPVSVFNEMCSQDAEKGHLCSVTQFLTPRGEGPGNRRLPADTDSRQPILSYVEELQAVDYHLFDKGLGLLRGTPAQRIPTELHKNP